MSTQSSIFLLAYLAVLLAVAYPMGLYLARVADSAPIHGLGWIVRVENLLYRIAGVNAQSAMNWKTYATALLLFNALGRIAN